MKGTPLPPDAPLPTTPDERSAYLKAAQENHDFAALARLFKVELLASPALARAMAPYFAGSHEHFAAFYANEKAAIYLKGPLVQQETERIFLDHRQLAAEHLWEIQQKKLFDLQCRWRAGQIELPGCRHTHEFKQWGEYVDHCPWLTPVSAADVALYGAYLRSGTYEPERVPRWQNYTAFRRAAEGLTPDDDHEHDPEYDPEYDDEAGGESGNAPANVPRRRRRPLPAWYVFHSAHTDTADLLRLPDLRTEKEQRYLHLTEAYNAEKDAERRAAGEAVDERPWHPMVVNAHTIGPYFELFEPAADLPRLRRWREAVAADDAHRHGALEEMRYWLETTLIHAPGTWPIAANSDWRLAIIEAGIARQAYQLARLVEEVWAEEQQNRALGLPVVPPAHYGVRAPFEEIDWAEEESYYPKFILRGRELAGEPRDFNF